MGNQANAHSATRYIRIRGAVEHGAPVVAICQDAVACDSLEDWVLFDTHFGPPRPGERLVHRSERHRKGLASLSDLVVVNIRLLHSGRQILPGPKSEPFIAQQRVVGLFLRVRSIGGS